MQVPCASIIHINVMYVFTRQRTPSKNYYHHTNCVLFKYLPPRLDSIQTASPSLRWNWTRTQLESLGVYVSRQKRKQTCFSGSSTYFRVGDATLLHIRLLLDRSKSVCL